jgi:hypothetical protein
VLDGVPCSTARRADSTPPGRHLDAVSDLRWRSVYQTTGNPERARAALAVLDRQERPIEPMVVRTPRPGDTYAQRLVVLLTEDSPSAAWTRLNDRRSEAEPRLNAFIARVLGDPRRYRFAGRIITDNKPARDVSLSLRQLRLSPLSLLLTARRGGPNQPSELEERIAGGFAAFLEPDDVNPRLELDAGPPAGVRGEAGLGPMLVLLDWLGNLVGARAADARDLALAQDLADTGIDLAELGARAARAVASFRGAAPARGLLRAAKPTERAAHAPSPAQSAAGASPRGSRARRRSRNRPTCRRVCHLAAELGRRGARHVTTAAATLAGSTRPSTLTPHAPEALNEYHLARIRALFGNDFRCCRASRSNAAELDASLAEQDALCAETRSRPCRGCSAWRSCARTRTGCNECSRPRSCSTCASRPRTARRPAAAPARQRWAALPQNPGTTWMPSSPRAPRARHSTSPPPRRTYVRRLGRDDSAAEGGHPGSRFTTTLPARAPHTTVLLAVAADPAETWSIDRLVDVVRGPPRWRSCAWSGRGSSMLSACCSLRTTCRELQARRAFAERHEVGESRRHCRRPGKGDLIDLSTAAAMPELAMPLIVHGADPPAAFSPDASLTVWSRLEPLPTSADLRPGCRRASPIRSGCWAGSGSSAAAGGRRRLAHRVRVAGEAIPLERFLPAPRCDAAARARDYAASPLPLEGAGRRRTGARAIAPRARGATPVPALSRGRDAAVSAVVSRSAAYALDDIAAATRRIDPWGAAWSALLADRAHSTGAARLTAFRPLANGRLRALSAPCRAAIGQLGRARAPRRGRWLRW